MAGSLVVSTVTDGTFSATPQEMQYGLAKAWIDFHGNVSGSPYIRRSWNVSSITDRGVGLYTINFAYAISSDDGHAVPIGVAFMGAAGSVGLKQDGVQGSTYSGLQCGNNNSAYDPVYVTAAWFGAASSDTPDVTLNI
jgi:hypothetical protein